MPKVVIIEDDPIIARIYENKLLNEGNKVAVASDGKSGIELVKSMGANLVLVDLMLPDMSGVEVIRTLRRDVNFANVPIIAYSGADEETLDKALEANSTRVLSKTAMSPKEIYENVRELLEASRSWQMFDAEPWATLPSAVVGESEAGTPKEEFKERVLIVEDDPLMVAIVKDIIEKAGYQTVVIDDGGEAFRLLKTDSNFAAAVFDVEVPKIQGIDLVRHMRTEKRLMKIPVMIMTAKESVRVQMDAQNAGASLFIPKPFERATFETLFSVLVGQKS